jgi:hypothetical protein
MNVRIYRCGWCGIPTDSTGVILSGARSYSAMRIIERYGDKRTTLTDCGCHRETENMMQVTHEMAMDAQDMSLEGQWI